MGKLSNIDDTNGTGEGTNKNIGIATYATNSDSWSYVKSGSSGDFLSGIDILLNKISQVIYILLAQ